MNASPGPYQNRVAALFHRHGARPELTTSGVLLARRAEAVAAYVAHVTVSLDEASAASYQASAWVYCGRSRRCPMPSC